MSIKDFRFDGEKKLNLKNEPTGAGDMKLRKKELVAKTAQNIAEAAQLQEMLYAERREGLVIAIQARDAAGKDSLIKHVFCGLNPAALKITSFKTPTKTELAHDYLWRINAALPERGVIGVFNRSHYEDVIAVRVHHYEKTYNFPDRCMTEDFFLRRYMQLTGWEDYLYENGYRVVKLFLNVSKETQSKRFIDRMVRDDKHWKLSTNDMKERALWEEYDKAFEDAINFTGTPQSPWYVVPADNKWYTRYIVSEILLQTLKDMDPHFPELDSAEAAKIPAIMEQLEQERAAKEMK
ncbi:MAG: polyphosphate kinase 2 family protein [Clostridia bacterium]|nr:polyphosphate kinase 2 family protein [Clostridia bacterium]